MRVCPTTRWHHFHGNDIMVVHMGVKNASGVFFWAEKPLKLWKDTTWSDSWMSSVLHTVIQWCFPSFDGTNNVHKDTSPWKQEFLERQFFAPMATTMIYYEDCMTLPA